MLGTIWWFFNEYFSITKDISCNGYNCDRFSFLTRSVWISNTNICPTPEFEYIKLRNIHNLNFIIAEPYNHIIQNIDTLTSILRHPSNVNAPYKKLILEQAAAYKTIMELKQYNVAQCLYINAFADFLINYYSNNCPDVSNELLKSYLKIFDRNVRVLHIRNTLLDYNQTTRFGNSRFFFQLWYELSWNDWKYIWYKIKWV